MITAIQHPAPGSFGISYQGNLVEIHLELSESSKGTAWLRTNWNRASISRADIIDEAMNGVPRQNRDWHDIRMPRTADSSFRIVLPMLEAGHFQAKAFFIPSNDSEAVWPDGENAHIKVEPADYFCSNVVYNAFVRQFGPSKYESSTIRNDDVQGTGFHDNDHHTVIPPSGTFRDLINELDFIITELGCRIIQLLPIHPIPTVYGRMGQFGSPFAALDFYDVDAGLAEFDRRASPMDQFVELVDAVHLRHAKLFLDIAINHTGWASKLQEHSPQWFVRDEGDEFFSPGAWGVVWADLIKLDYCHHDLWKYMADVFLSWCRRGVDGFRCDAGYKVPVEAWEFIVAVVRDEFPDTVFLLEGLGGEIRVTRDLLVRANLNWAYSELFQNYHRSAIESYLPDAIKISQHEGVLLNFAETHDNNRLAAVSHRYAHIRTALAALTSIRGAYGFANGVEWLATEKIDVHQANGLNWGSAENMVHFIKTLNRIVATHPTFYRNSDCQMIQQGGGNSIAFYRRTKEEDAWLLVLVNLDHDQPNPVYWPASAVPEMGAAVVDLLNDEKFSVAVNAEYIELGLNAGEVKCLTSPDWNEVTVTKSPQSEFARNNRNTQQRLRHKAVEFVHVISGLPGCLDIDPDEAAARLFANPAEFCEDECPDDGELKLVLWEWPTDASRVAMAPPGFAVYLVASAPFSISLIHSGTVHGREISLPQEDGRHFILLPPRPTPDRHLRVTIRFTVHGADHCRKCDADLLYLSDVENALVQLRFDRKDVLSRRLSVLGTNGRGAMVTANAPWGTLRSKYDALLAANLHAECPVDRHIMLTRCRLWIVSRNYSHAVGVDCLEQLHVLNDGSSIWTYAIPGANGKLVKLSIRLRMIPGANKVELIIHRRSQGTDRQYLWDHEQVTLIVRPDIEDRNFHTTTNADVGAKQHWPDSITIGKTEFTFAPDIDRHLRVCASSGMYKSAPEWQHRVHLPDEADRGLGAYTDLFSPGYFEIPLDHLGEVIVSATIMDQPITAGSGDRNATKSVDLTSTIVHEKHSDVGQTETMHEAMNRALSRYIVARGDNATVIAGYPWFLDWGRDTLIVVRGMVAANRTTEVRSILSEFARFEDRGTLPNMIRGADTGDRDTSDAPLWFVVACQDLMEKEGDSTLLKMRCGRRSLASVVRSIVMSYIEGTPNGIRMDPDSGLIYSPSHFTWMDTNYPAGTPRQGYPIEIQALWYAAVRAAAEWLSLKRLRQLANQVRESIEHCFGTNRGYLSDCLHANRHVPAAAASPDDALRPNQLLAITLGAVEKRDSASAILSACQSLLLPGAIRSLADRPVVFPLPVYRDGAVINDPSNPYWGRYEGDEDSRRKPAYHNGTAWTWMFSSYAEAWYNVYGECGRKTALALLGSSTEIINRGCIGHVPEIVDGNCPHQARGCSAQAWGASELLRVLTLLEAPTTRSRQ